MLSILVGFLLRATGSGSGGYFFIAAPLLLICVITLPILYATGRRGQRQLQELVDGGSWAHWTYGGAEWRTFTDAEWERAGRNAKRLTLQVVGMMLLVGAALHFMQDRLSFLEGVLFGGAIGVPLGIVIGVISWLIARGTYRERLAGAGEVYIGPAGVYQDGSYTTWKSAGLTLKGVKIETGDPSVLQFDIDGYRGAQSQVRVAIPKGKEEEAVGLVALFGSFQVPSAGDDRLQAWLGEVTARLEPDRIAFGPGEKLVDVFQRTFAEEEQRVRTTEQDPGLRSAKLRMLEELRRKFA